MEAYKEGGHLSPVHVLPLLEGYFVTEVGFLGAHDSCSRMQCEEEEDQEWNEDAVDLDGLIARASEEGITFWKPSN